MNEGRVGTVNGRAQVVLLVTLAALALGSGCVFDDDIGETEGAALAITLPAVEGLEEVSLTIYRDATCAGNRALGGSPLVGFSDIRLRENEDFAGSIPVGNRAFEIQGQSATVENLCVGACEEAEVVEGMLVVVTLDVLEVTCSN